MISVFIRMAKRERGSDLLLIHQDGMGEAINTFNAKWSVEFFMSMIIDD